MVHWKVFALKMSVDCWIVGRMVEVPGRGQAVLLEVCLPLPPAELLVEQYRSRPRRACGGFGR